MPGAKPSDHLKPMAAIKPPGQISAGVVAGPKKVGLKDTDESDDPIAQSLALRIKAGGITSVVSAQPTDPKK